jgi:hypothetical protein
LSPSPQQSLFSPIQQFVIVVVVDDVVVVAAAVVVVVVNPNTILYPLLVSQHVLKTQNTGSVRFAFTHSQKKFFVKL